MEPSPIVLIPPEIEPVTLFPEPPAPPFPARPTVAPNAKDELALDASAEALEVTDPPWPPPPPMDWIRTP